MDVLLLSNEKNELRVHTTKNVNLKNSMKPETNNPNHNNTHMHEICTQTKQT